jgi:hypothetical protein
LRWYCRSCWLQGRYAYNDPPPPAMEHADFDSSSSALPVPVIRCVKPSCACKDCGLVAKEAGWGHWVPAVQAPRAMVQAWDRRRNSPPWLRMLRLRWPQVRLSI